MSLLDASEISRLFHFGLVFQAIFLTYDYSKILVSMEFVPSFRNMVFEMCNIIALVPWEYMERKF